MKDAREHFTHHPPVTPKSGVIIYNSAMKDKPDTNVRLLSTLAAGLASDTATDRIRCILRCSSSLQR